MGFKEPYQDVLKKKNLKVTKHRYTILKALESNKLPVTAEDLYFRLKEKGISISLSTVYSSMESLH